MEGWPDVLHERPPEKVMLKGSSWLLVRKARSPVRLVEEDTPELPKSLVERLPDVLRAYCSVPAELGREKPVEMGEEAGSAWATDAPGTASNGRSRQRAALIWAAGCKASWKMGWDLFIMGPRWCRPGPARFPAYLPASMPLCSRRGSCA